MRQNIAFLLLLAFLAGACNKDSQPLEQLPFSVFPNPCRGQVSVFYSGPPAGNITFSLYDPEGNLMLRNPDFGPGQQVTSALGEAGIYSVEVNVDGDVFKAEILNLD